MSATGTAALLDAVEKLHTASLPLVALYAFDATWAMGVALAEAIGEVLGARYDLLADFWAFRVPPGRAGWAPHRGVNEVLDRAQPELLNVWLALSDAAVDQACMHFVSLDDDPAYLRGDLNDIVPSTTFAAPVAAATALFWNANVLHWGGPCLTSAAAPRISVTFTLARVDSAYREASFRASELSPWERLDAIAGQIEVYGETEGVPRDLLEWAAISRKMRARLVSPP